MVGVPRIPPRGKPSAKRGKRTAKLPDALTEHEEQVLVVTYLHKRNLLVFAVPNGAKRNQRQGAWLKAEGLSAGCPDLCVPMPRNGFHGLFIEMKKTTGSVVQETQRYWQEQLRKQGYRAEICRGHDAAIQVIEEYFDNVKML